MNPPHRHDRSSQPEQWQQARTESPVFTGLFHSQGALGPFSSQTHQQTPSALLTDLGLNVPIGAATLALAPRIVPESRLATRRRFDALGAIAGTGGLVLLVDAISQAPQYGWGATRTIALLAASAALLAAFLVIENRATDPVLPLSIFQLRTLAGANVAGLLLGGSFFAFIFVGTLYMQQVLHYSALQTGVAWLAASLTSIALAGVSQALVTRGGAKVVMAIGMTLIGAGVLWATQVPSTGTSSRTSPARSSLPAPGPRSRSSRSRSPRSRASQSTRPGSRPGC